MNTCCKHETLCHCCAIPRPITKPWRGRTYFHMDGEQADLLLQKAKQWEVMIGNDLHGGTYYTLPRQTERRAS